MKCERPRVAAHDVNFAQETLTRHKPMVAEYLDENYDQVRYFPLAI
jgi:hypothetical protein